MSFGILLITKVNAVFFFQADKTTLCFYLLLDNFFPYLFFIFISEAIGSFDDSIGIFCHCHCKLPF